MEVTLQFEATNSAERSKEIFEREKKRFQEARLTIVLSHFGYFSQDLVNGFTEGVEELLTSAGEKKGLIKRVFSIMIEGLQNIRFHGSPDENNKYYGMFFMAKNSEKLVLVLGSLITPERKENLEARLQKLNEMPEEDIKGHYMSVLTNGEMSELGNAGLGFITMRMKSKSPLTFRFIPLSDSLYQFLIEIPVMLEATDPEAK